MSFIGDKSEIFNEVAANRALKENFPKLNKTVNSFASIKNKEGNITPFLLDLLVEVGEKSLDEDVFKPLLEKSVSWEKDVKDFLVDNITSFYTNRDFNLNNIVQPFLNINIKDIDLNDTLKIDENSDIGKFYYGQNQEQLFTEINNTTPTIEFNSNVPGNFTLFLRKVLKTGSGRWKDQLDFLYDPLTENLSVSMVDTNQTFENFIRKNINSIKIFDLSKTMSNLIDFNFGTISSLTDIGRDYLEDLVKSREIIDKIINKESLSETEFNTYDDSFFIFTKEEEDRIKFKTDSIINGTNLVNLGCGRGSTFIDINSFSVDFDNLNSFRPSLVKKAFTNATDKLLKDSTSNLNDEDKKSSLLNLIKELIKTLPTIFIQQVLQPFVVMIMQGTESIINNLNGGVSLNNLGGGKLQNFIINFRQQIVCIVKKIYSLIVEYIFGIIRKEIINLVTIKTKKIIEEKSLQYREQVRRAREILDGVNNILSLINNT